jgi:hypothetical protein
VAVDRLLADLRRVPLYLQEAPAMTVQSYQVQLVRPDGSREIVVFYANGSTHAHYIATELNPGSQVNVLGLLPEWSGDDSI